jgi:uncharacterized protein YqeY
MSIEQQLTDRMKEAMRSKKTQELDALRMVKSAAQTAKTASGFDGKVDDAFWLDVIQKYVKQQQRAIGEFEKAGESGRDHIERLHFEISYFADFLPKKMGDAELRALVKQAVEETGALNAKMAGKVMGHIMKSHKDLVDAETLKAVVMEVLGP